MLSLALSKVTLPLVLLTFMYGWTTFPELNFEIPDKLNVDKELVVGKSTPGLYALFTPPVDPALTIAVFNGAVGELALLSLIAKSMEVILFAWS